MIKRSGTIAAVLLLCSINLYALTFTVNGELWSEKSDSELDGLLYSIPFGEDIYQGISADELFPAVFEAWRLEIEHDDSTGTLRLTDPDLAGSLPKTYFIKREEGWSLLYKNRFFNNIRAVDIECELLEPAPLEIWIHWEGLDLLRAEINRYARLHGTEVKITEVPRPDSKLVSVTQAGGAIPDIIMVQSSYISRLAGSNSIQNLDYMFPPGMTEQGRYAFTLEDKVWAIPFYYDAQMFFCNPALMTPPDYDWDLRNYEDLAAGAAEEGYIPSAWNSYSASFLIPFQLAFGKERLVEPDGSIIINDEPTLNALEYILTLQDDGLMQPMERDAMTSLFVSGKAAMIISASYSIPHFEELGIPFTAIPMPVNPGTGVRVAPLLDFKAFAISKRSKNTVGARRLIEYLCGLGVQQRFTAATAKLPALSQAWTLSASGNSYYEALKISSESGVVIPTEKAYAVYKNTMWKMLRFAISGRMPAAEVLKKTQELVDKNMEER